ncbi:MAG TPA: lysophospholipid acyltransferase family protein [Chitinophagaceae bacterium]|nr:lysophospholipid acyltransferase family protein [Chitinophagaceae bacterium]
MKILLKPLQIIYCIYALLIFIILMFLALPFVVAASASGIKGGNFIYKVCLVWTRIWYFFIGIQHKEIYEAAHDKKQQYIFVANHISYMDIPPIVAAIRQPLRVLGKYEMIRIPVFGWIYKAAVILVDRRDATHRSKSVRALKAAIKHGISIFIFPEGTFNITGKPLKDFYDGAFRIAIETKTPIKPLLFIDTIDRLHYKNIFELTPGKCRVVFLDEVEVKHLTMKDIQHLKHQVYRLMEEGLKRYRKY